MDVKIYPYGNARQTENPDGTWTITCQHGPEECEGNLYEACIIDRLDSDPQRYLDPIFCIEKAPEPIEAIQKCVEFNPELDWADIDACAKVKKNTDSF